MNVNAFFYILLFLNFKEVYIKKDGDEVNGLKRKEREGGKKRERG